MPNIYNLKTVDHTGKIDSIKIFLQHNQWSIVFFHESPGCLKELLDKGININKTIIILTFSWYLDEKKCEEMRSYLAELVLAHDENAKTIINNTIFCVNSQRELKNLRTAIPGNNTVVCNNTVFLSEDHYSIIQIPQTYAAVINAKPLKFKRAELAASTPRLLAITYGIEQAKNSPDFFDPHTLKYAKVLNDIPEQKVPEIINTAFCGLILSEVEGACYASTEYLLCGLPVVSTPSLGGRDEFYGKNNSVIVEPTEHAVLDAVIDFESKGRRGLIDRETIRNETMKQFIFFRQSLCERISMISGIDALFLSNMLNQKIRKSSKLWDYKNFWIKSLTD